MRTGAERQASLVSEGAGAFDGGVVADAATSAAVMVPKARHRPRRGRLADRQRLLTSALGVVAMVGIWQLVATALIRDPVFLPSPSEVARTLVLYLHTPYPGYGVPLWDHALTSSTRVVEGFVLSSVLGICIGSLMVGVRPVRHLLDPVIEMIRPLPPLAFIPLLVVWLGIGELPKVALLLIGFTPLIAVGTAAALDQVERDLLNAARCLGASSSHIMFRVRLRAAVPQMITTMRIALAGAWTTIVAVEMIAATAGLGFVILQASTYLFTSLVFAGMVCIAFLGIGMDCVLRLLHRLLDPTMRRGD